MKSEVRLSISYVGRHGFACPLQPLALHLALPNRVLVGRAYEILPCRRPSGSPAVQFCCAI